ncbi:MAG: hypothetical protein F4164_03290 [Gemmatimonadales bacterium]|nr:hypothetical protein [Gemmatimonadales bacterium]
MGLRKNGAQEEALMHLGQSRFERGNPAATAVLMACVLASVGCDGAESPFAPDFGVAEPSRLTVPADPPAVEDPPAAAIDIPSSSGDETADSSVTPAEDQPKSAPAISRVSIRPLVVVDGIMLPDDWLWSDIEDLDIYHVEIVKGAAAIMLYGPRARGSAIDIRTKRGAQATLPNGPKPR